MFRFVRWHRGASGPPQCLSVTSFNGDFGVRQLRCWRHRGRNRGERRRAVIRCFLLIGWDMLLPWVSFKRWGIHCVTSRTVFKFFFYLTVCWSKSEDSNSWTDTKWFLRSDGLSVCFLSLQHWFGLDRHHLRIICFCLLCPYRHTNRY